MLVSGSVGWCLEGIYGAGWIIKICKVIPPIYPHLPGKEYLHGCSLNENSYGFFLVTWEFMETRIKVREVGMDLCTFTDICIDVGEKNAHSLQLT